jgi:rfaE bifunctional protein kinase chain/domain
MIDSYVWGFTDRISPEAPVPVVNVQRRENRMGGAANVALNVAALGATPVLCAVVGQEADGDTFFSLLEQRGLPAEGMVRSASRMTTVKHRILAGSQQLLRVDAETTVPLNEEEQISLWGKIEQLLPQAHVVIFEDYDKGVLSEELIGKIVELAHKHQIPTVVDPKKRNFWAYRGVSLFKPNLKELRDGLNLEVVGNQRESLEYALERLREKMPVEACMVTLSQYGLFISDFQEKHLLPAHRREIADVSGAGDTVVSIAALCLAAGADWLTTGSLANLGGGLVCETLGVVPIDRDRLEQEARRIITSE